MTFSIFSTFTMIYSINEQMNRILEMKNLVWKAHCQKLYINTKIIIPKLNKIKAKQKLYFKVNKNDTFGNIFGKQRTALIRLDLLTLLI